MNAKFIHQVLSVFLDRFDADVEFAGDLLIGSAFGNELKNFYLAAG